MSTASARAAHEAAVGNQVVFAHEMERLNEAGATFAALRLGVMNRIASGLAEHPSHDLSMFMMAMYGERTERSPEPNSPQAQCEAAEQLFGTEKLNHAFGQPVGDNPGKPALPDRLHRIRPSLYADWKHDESEEVNKYYRPDAFSAVRYRARLEDNYVVGEVYVPTVSVTIDGFKVGEPVEDECILQRIRRPLKSTAPLGSTKLDTPRFGMGLLTGSVSGRAVLALAARRLAVLTAAEDKLEGALGPVM